MSVSEKSRAVASAICLFVCSLSSHAAAADKRELNLHNVNTHEDLRIVFKKDGVYDQAALQKLNWFFRDWRMSEPTRMDPKVFDLLERVYSETGSDQQINVHSGYRSPRTNAMLRATTFGVARESQHMEGKAIDFHIPGVATSKVRAIALKLQDGGVGYYPTSRSPFVHIDVAEVRAWPRPTRQLLASIFPDGKTVHIPADGRPLPHYDEAMAELKGKKLGILSVIGDIAGYVKPKKVKPMEAEQPKVAALAFTPPVPVSRPPLDPATSFMANPMGELAFAPTRAASPKGSVFDDPFAFIESRRKALREENQMAIVVEQPINFRTVDIEKSGRHGTAPEPAVR
ncbi:DUF882 domain-containing protein [Rhizobium sp. BK176]|uniref:DUF882 domain-containing protein n=1 Tax=Rhizobium sp. BK176 TaxID=2587071 RepID=UPI002168874B|nr:DUF882 domain-containing protein [Rhizobium sp. BK176]MCS4090037.1 uncharacterized protein YcbK (DUF882 family) [Rhizobium sp. BK176]